MYYIRETAAGITWSPRGRTGGFTLVEAMRETYGVGGMSIVREDGTLVVSRCGSSVSFVHAPSGREITRRPRSSWRILARPGVRRTPIAPDEVRCPVSRECPRCAWLRTGVRR